MDRSVALPLLPHWSELPACVTQVNSSVVLGCRLLPFPLLGSTGQPEQLFKNMADQAGLLRVKPVYAPTKDTHDLSSLLSVCLYLPRFHSPLPTQHSRSSADSRHIGLLAIL